MQKFELYHPINTQHLTWDWLTFFKIAEIMDARADNDLNQTAADVNEIMRKIMHNETLVWGIKRQKHSELLGIVGFEHFDSTNNRATLLIENKALDESQLTEVVRHLLDLAQHEFKLNSVSISALKLDDSTKKVLSDLEFQINDNTFVKKL